MCIKGLHDSLKSVTKYCSIEEFRGKCLGIDASCYLYKGAYSCAKELGLGIPTTK
jgi:exonuclease-1